jgi:uncharacterized repeat protein (TIGR03803 family)
MRKTISPQSSCLRTTTIARWFSVAVLALGILPLNAACWASTETLLHQFGAGSAGDGKGSPAGLIADGSGNLYGVTQYGGAHGNGTVFELSPGTGGIPIQARTHRRALDGAGNLYGTTLGGGIACPNRSRKT